MTRWGLDTVPTTMNNGRLNIPDKPNAGDVLSITNPNGSTPY